MGMLHTYTLFPVELTFELRMLQLILLVCGSILQKIHSTRRKKQCLSTNLNLFDQINKRYKSPLG